MRKILLYLLLILSINTYGQNSIQLSFNGEHLGNTITMDSVYVFNKTKNVDTTLYYPNLTLTLNLTTGVNSGTINQSALKLTQNYPNPFTDYTSFDIETKFNDNITIKVYNIKGQLICNYNEQLEQGKHTFVYYPGSDKQIFVSVSTSRETQSISMIYQGQNSSTPCRLEKQNYQPIHFSQKLNSNYFNFTKGDELSIKGYSTTCTLAEENIIEDAPLTDKTYTFTFNRSVPSTPASITGNSNICQTDVNVEFSTQSVQGVTYSWNYSGVGASIEGGNTNAITIDFNETSTSGILTVTPSNECGDGPVQTLNIQVNERPNVSIQASETEIFNGSSVQLSASGASSYQWNNGLSSSKDQIVSPSQTTTYTVTGISTEGCSNQTSVTITVKNHPVAMDDNENTNEDTPILINVVSNDSDADADPITVTEFTQPANGAVTLEQNQLRYTPNADFFGSDSFTYTISDGNGGTATATVNITVNPVNDAPVAVDDNATVNEDATVLIDIVANDTDKEGDTVTPTGFTNPSNGTVSQEGDSYRYTPNADFFGSDSFTYTISDGNGGTATATVNITVNSVNDAPVAVDDNATVNEDATVLIDIVANDTDKEGDTVTPTGFTNPSNGTVSQEGDSYRYTPNADFFGSDSFTYTISDGNGGTATATVNITVNSVNDAPVAVDDNATVNEDATVLIDIVANDTDKEGDTVTPTGFTNPSNGTVSQEGDSYRYTPNADFFGSDSFTYTISDGNGGTATATVNITVNPVNDAPVAVDDNATVNEDATVLIDIVANDTDKEGDTVTPTGFTNPSNGTVSQEGDSYRYTPNADFFGSDSFTYTISDGNGGTATATVNITVNSVNDAPVAVDDNATVNEDATVLIDIVANDTDKEGDTVTPTGFTNPSNGTVSQEGDSYRYTPNADFFGSDSFTYTISDGNGGTATATVNITVNSVNDAPVAVDDNATVNEDATVLIDIVANDTDKEGDTVTPTGFTNPSNGTVSQEGDSYRYTPNADFFGSDSFTYTISDGNGGTATATVSITVNPVNDAPVAVDDNATVNEDATVLIDIVANDTDKEGDTVTPTGFTNPSNGTVSQEGDSYRYTPNADFFGSDSFTYTISDGNGGTATATVSITVNPVNDAPVAVDDNATVNEDATVLIDIVANDTDKEGDTVTPTGFTNPSNGTVSQEGDSYRYTPNADFFGSDSFTYTISDGNGGTATATVSITVNPVNDAPVAVDDNATVNEDATVLIDIVANDTDKEGDTVTPTGFTNPSNGTVSQEGDSYRYTPNADFFGSDSFTYTISDGNGGTATATVNITVNSVNDAPVAVDDNATVENTATILIDVINNDTDKEGDTIGLESNTNPSNGTVSKEGDSYRYTPNAGFVGSDSFTYTISDGNGGYATATVNITITGSIINTNIDLAAPSTDYIELTITSSNTYEIKTSFYLQACDTRVVLYNSSYSQIAENDDYVDLYGCIIMSLSPGTYYIKVFDFDNTHVYCNLEVKKQ